MNGELHDPPCQEFWNRQHLIAGEIRRIFTGVDAVVEVTD